MEILRSSIDDHVTDLQQQQQQQQQQKLLQEEEGQHFHVLAVDDSLVDRKLLEKLLKVSSYKVTCVDSGDEALKYLGLVDDDVDKNSGASTSSSSSSSTNCPQSPQEGTKVNLIMTDYCMPGMSGYDLLKRVKRSSWKDVPVVIMSSENDPCRISKCLEGGAEKFLLKPVQLSDLKNLEHYLLKPLIDHSCESKINNNNNNNTEDDLAEKNDSDNDFGVVDSNNSTNTMISKRKAVMSPSPSERRPNKVKGLAVI